MFCRISLQIWQSSLSKTSFKLQNSIPVHRARQTNGTCFSRYLQEGIDTTLAIVALRGQRGDVVPAHGLDNVHHGLCLVGVGRHHTGEELVAAFVTQLGGSGGVADLWNLKREDKSAAVKMSGQVRGKKKRRRNPAALDIRAAKKLKKRKVLLHRLNAH